MPTDDFDDYLWLTSDAAERWLADVSSDDRPTLRIAQSLRRELSAARTHLVLEQVELRKRAEAKFPHAERMFFTRKGLEQATDFWTAKYKANRFPDDDVVADLCCGIGGDMVALADRGPVLAIDSDPIPALFAQVNARILGLSGRATVVRANVADADFLEVAAWHIDPDRRPGGRRTSSLDYSVPPRNWVYELHRQIPNGMVKLAPSDDVIGPIETDNLEWEYISREGAVRQQLIYLGSLVREPHRTTCTMLSRDGKVIAQYSVINSIILLEEMLVGRPVEAPVMPDADRVGAYVYEPDPVMLIGGVIRALADKYCLSSIAPWGGYLTSDERISDPALTGFHVIDFLPFDRKRIKSLLASRAIGQLEVKSRERTADACRLQREFRTSDEGSATLLLTRIHGKAWAILAERIGAL